MATLEITIAGLPPPPAGSVDVWDYLMERLLRHPAIADPVVSNDSKKGEVWLSFEFEATGVVQVDVPKALGFLVEATRMDEQLSPFDWEQWLEGPGSAKTIQYPVPA